MRKSIKSALFVCSMLAAGTAGAQVNSNSLNGREGSRVITTTVPFLNITPDSRSGAMADAGVAISPDANSMAWNAAKIAFAPDDAGVSITYTPWLRKLVPDISLAYLSGYKRIDKLSGFGASLRYFSLGDINFTNDQGQQLRTFRPNEFAVDAGYARKLSTHLSIGVTGRFIYSDLAGVTQLSSGLTTKPGYSFAGDISAYYTKKVKVSGVGSDLSFGGNISNLGGKISYTTIYDRDFLPANLKLGAALDLHINEYNDFTIAFDINKLLVPTPPVYQRQNPDDPSSPPVKDPNNPGHYLIASGKDPDVPVIQGAIQSFYDAPGGFKEELQEIDPSIGFEYWYMKMFAARAGYFYENPNKGNRQYITVGIGLRYSILDLDLSYLIATNSATTFARSPLENTLRFTLMFSLGRDKNKSQGNTNSANPTAP